MCETCREKKIRQGTCNHCRGVPAGHIKNGKGHRGNWRTVEKRGYSILDIPVNLRWMEDGEVVY